MESCKRLVDLRKIDREVSNMAVGARLMATKWAVRRCKKSWSKPADYLLGRKTFAIWAPYWPEHADFWPGINSGTKYILSKTMKKSDWKNTVFLKSLADIKKLKNSKGPDIQVWGSGQAHSAAA